jgi:ribokinase
MDGAVGRGTEGKEVIRELCDEVRGVEDVGVEVKTGGEKGRILEDRIRVWEEGSTGKAMIQRAQDGENSISEFRLLRLAASSLADIPSVILAGANFSEPPSPYTPLIPENTTHLLLANEIPFQSTLDYLKAAASSSPKVTSIYNPSPMPSADQLRTFPWHQVDWLIVNEGELGDIAGSVFDSSASISSDVKSAVESLTKASANDKVDEQAAITVAQSLHTLLPQLAQDKSERTVNIICTLGAKGVLYVRSPAYGEEVVKRLSAAKLLRPIRDTTGAGDCFMGYLAAGLMRLQKEDKSVDDGEAFDGVIKRCLTVCPCGVCRYVLLMNLRRLVPSVSRTRGRRIVMVQLRRLRLVWRRIPSRRPRQIIGCIYSA